MAFPVVAAAALGAAGGSYGSLWGPKRPKVPKELGEIAAQVMNIGKNLRSRPDALRQIAETLTSGADLWSLPPEQLQQIANSFDAAGAVRDANAGFDRQQGYANEAAPWLNEVGRRGGAFADNAAANSAMAGEQAQDLYQDSYAPIESQAARDAMAAGTQYEQERLAGVAAGRARGALAQSHAQALDAARLRGVAPTAAAMVDPTQTAVGADLIARQAFDAGENERRLGFSMRSALLPYAGALSRRGALHADDSARLSQQAQQLRSGGVSAGSALQNGITAGRHNAAILGGAGQALHQTAWDADNQHRLNQENSLRLGFNAHQADHNSYLDTEGRRAGFLNQAFGHYRGNHQDRTNRWAGRTADVQRGIGAVSDALFSTGGALSGGGGGAGGGGAGGGWGAHNYGGSGGYRALNSLPGISGINRFGNAGPAIRANPHTR